MPNIINVAYHVHTRASVYMTASFFVQDSASAEFGVKV